MNNKFFWLQKQSEITCVYYLQHNPSNRRYIGKSRAFQKRISSHLTMLKNKTHHTKSIKELNYALTDWSFGILETYSRDIEDNELFQKEVEWWEKEKQPFNNKPKKGSNRRKKNATMGMGRSKRKGRKKKTGTSSTSK